MRPLKSAIDGLKLNDVHEYGWINGDACAHNCSDQRWMRVKGGRPAHLKVTLTSNFVQHQKEANKKAPLPEQERFSFSFLPGEGCLFWAGSSVVEQEVHQVLQLNQSVSIQIVRAVIDEGYAGS